MVIPDNWRARSDATAIMIINDLCKNESEVNEFLDIYKNLKEKYKTYNH